MLEHAEVPLSWQQLMTQPVFAVCYSNSTAPYIETPDEQGLSDTQPQEGLVRVFLCEEEAVNYISVLETYNDEEFAFMEMPFGALFNCLLQSERLTGGYPVRFDLSTAAPLEWPKSMETIWVTNAMVH